MSMGSLSVSVEAVSLCGPGLQDWASSLPVLTGKNRYQPAPAILPSPPGLSAAEQRRAVPSVKLALSVGAAAVRQSRLDPASLPAVFASSGADGQTIDAILTALTLPAREVSPTRFHNSVHNAPSGYWGLAMQSQETVSSVSCHDASFAAGLLEAAVQVVAGGQQTLLVAYDLPYPQPLNFVRHIDGSFSVAFVLSPVRTDRTLAELHLTLATVPGDTTSCADQAMEDLRRKNPAARALPLLVAMAHRKAGSIRLELSRGALDVEVVPC
jgi:Beta-ketoacyl synthase, N-terminal domain